MDYQRRFAGPVGNYFLTVQATTVLELLERYPTASVLDVGGGHGQLAKPLVQRGYEVSVIGSHESCRERLEEMLPQDKFRFFTGNLLKLPFETNSFDLVLGFRLISHLVHWREALHEMCRVARTAVLIDYPDMRSVNLVSKPLFKLKKMSERNTRPFTCFSRKSIAEEFSAHGFSNLEFRPQFFVPMVVHRIMRAPLISKALEGSARMTGLTHFFGSPVIVAARSGDLVPTQVMRDK